MRRSPGLFEDVDDDAESTTTAHEDGVRFLTLADYVSSGAQPRRRVDVRLFGHVRIRFGKVAANIILTLVAMTAGVGDIVSLPILTDSLDKHVTCGVPKKIGNTYFVNFYGILWLAILFVTLATLAWVTVPGFHYQSYLSHKFRILIAAFGSMSYFLQVYSSPPDRTPERLQSLLYLSLIPFTVVIRWLVLRKGVSAAHLICTFVVLVGLCIALEPNIFEMNNEKKPVTRKDKLHALWSCLFVVSFIPLAVLNVLIERSFEKRAPGGGDAIHPLMLAMWLNVWGLLFMSAFFWLDFLPDFGEVSNFDEFSSAFNDGFMCMLGSAPSPGNCSITVPTAQVNPDPDCHIPIGRFWLWIFFFISDNFATLLLFMFSDGAIYMAIVASLKSPLAAIFWMLFNLDAHSTFTWHPRFNTSSIYVLCGLAMMIPAACVYNYLSLKADMAEAAKQSRSSEGNEDGLGHELVENRADNLSVVKLDELC